MSAAASLVRSLSFASLALVPIAALAQAPGPITVLVIEGDTISGIGTVTTIDNLAINAAGQWMVQVDTDAEDTDADQVLLRDGLVWLREGDPLAAPAGATVDGFDAVTLNVDTRSGLDLFLADVPAENDMGVYLDQSLLVQEGDELAPGVPYIGFLDVKINAAEELAVVASVADPAVAGEVERVIVVLETGPGGELVAQELRVEEGVTMLPDADGALQTVVDVGRGPHEWAWNDAGELLFLADFDPAAGIDGIYLGSELVAIEDGPSPLVDRSYQFLSSRGMDLNGAGQWVFKANLDGEEADDELIQVGQSVFVREGDTISATGGAALTGFGLPFGPVEIDDDGNVLWFGSWDDDDEDSDTGLFFNNALIIEEGVTNIDGQLVDAIAAGQNAFALSEQNRYVIFEATLADGREGAFLVQIDPAAPAVADGAAVPGQMMTARRLADGAIEVEWDAVRCCADHHLFHGPLEQVRTLSYAGAACGLGDTGRARFDAPGGNVFWLIAGVDARGREGGHGYDSAGRPRTAHAGGRCGVVALVHTRTCP